MSYIIIKSNSGNHSGINRKWELIGVEESRKRAHSTLVSESLKLDDDHLIINGRAYDTFNKEYIFTNKMKSFRYDGHMYCMLSIDKVDSFFDGGYHGHKPSFVSGI